MSDRCRARVIRVKRDKHGAVLASAASIGDTVLLVKDAGDLAVDDETTGTLLVNDDAATQLVYTDVEYVEDTDPGDLTTPDTVTLSEELAVAIDANTQLWVYEDPDDADPDFDDDGIVSDFIAICIPEDDEDAAELGGRLRAIVPPGLHDDLPVGQQPGRGIPVVLEFDDDTDDWTVLRLRGGTPRGLRYNRHVLSSGDAPAGGTVGDPVTTDEIAAGVFTRQLPHRRIARSKAFRPMVNGIEYGPDQWSLDATNGVVTVTMGDWETVNEAFWFEYWHRGLAVIPADPDPPAPPTVISIDSVFQHGWPGSSADGTYTLTGLQAGDLVVAVLRSSSSTMDSRFTMVCDLGNVSGISGPYSGKVWAATIAGDTSDVTFPHAGAVLRLRNGSGTPLHLDPSRVSLPDGSHAGGAGSIAALPGGGSGAISAILTGGGIGGAYGTTSWPAPWDPIDGSNDTDGGTYGLVYLTYTTAETVGAIAAPQHDSADTWRGCALGIGYA